DLPNAAPAIRPGLVCGPVPAVSDCLSALYPAGLSLQKTRPDASPRRSSRGTLIQESEFRSQNSGFRSQNSEFRIRPEPAGPLARRQTIAQVFLTYLQQPSSAE